MPDVKIELIRDGAGPVIYVIGEAEAAHAAALCMNGDACVAAMVPPDWNGSLSPWNAPACFRNGGDFSGGADDFLEKAVVKISAFEAVNALSGRRRFVCGYSLAGLCALYALYVKDVFDGAASISGSMWFDGWISYMENDKRSMAGKKVYFSVGDREKKTRNQRLACVEDCTRTACLVLKDRGAEAVFELNPGNHFADHDRRVARAMNWLCGESAT